MNSAQDPQKKKRPLRNAKRTSQTEAKYMLGCEGDDKDLEMGLRLELA